MGPRQSQKGGSGSQQMQVSGDLVVINQQGVTEERAAEIARDTLAEAIATYSDEAKSVGARRAEAMDERLIAVLSQDRTLAAMADPAFQVLLRKAQLGAASSDRESDYDILASLLGDRASRDDRPVRASIDRAVQVVDLLDDKALAGLTVAAAVQQFSPLSGLVAEGLDAMDALFSQLCTVDLPDGDAWLDHLDTLDALRPGTFGLQTLKKLNVFWGEKMVGYVSPGVPDAEAEELVSKLREACVPALPVIPHELKPGYRRVGVVNDEASRRLLSNHMTLSQERIDAMFAVARDVGHLGATDGDCLNRLDGELAARPALGKVKAWWDGIPNTFQITGVGRVLARANANRLDERGLLPPLD